MKNKITNNKLIKKAFSLIELSVVVAVVGVMTAAIVGGSSLLNIFKDFDGYISEKRGISTSKGYVFNFDGNLKSGTANIMLQNLIILAMWQFLKLFNNINFVN
jgi:prepilin-type N-terminal cleavage/methylation domain-containing protein